LDIIGMDGHRVDVSGLKAVGDVRVLDLSSLRAGVYIVRLSTWMTTQTMKFMKKP
jgi:pectate lyase